VFHPSVSSAISSAAPGNRSRPINGATNNALSHFAAATKRGAHRNCWFWR